VKYTNCSGRGLGEQLGQERPAHSVNEKERLAAVRRYQILDTPSDGAFDRVAAIAARVFKVPIATVTIVDEDRIWCKARHGVDVEEIPRSPGSVPRWCARTSPTWSRVRRGSLER
jgi:hypothetical protein